MKRCLLVCLLLVAAAVPAAASANPGDKSLASYCSPTGDYCTGVVKAKGTAYFTLRTFSFSDKYKVCVDPPFYPRECSYFFSLTEGKHGIYASREELGKYFPIDYAGRYKIAWYYGGSRLGKPLYFTLPGKPAPN